MFFFCTFKESLHLYKKLDYLANYVMNLNVNNFLKREFVTDQASSEIRKIELFATNTDKVFSPHSARHYIYLFNIGGIWQMLVQP